MVSLRWTRRAERDLAAIHEYISKDSVRAADELITRLMDSTRRLSEFPLSGRMVPEFGREDLREIIVADYRLVYRVVGDTASVAFVHHGARRMR